MKATETRNTPLPSLPLTPIMPQEKTIERGQIFMALFALYIIWGSTYLAMRFAMSSVPPLLMTGSRFLVAGLILYTVLRVRRHERPTWRQWLGGAIVGGLLVMGGNGGVTIAEGQAVASGLAAVAVAAMPLWAALFFGFLGRWPARLEWVGLGVGFVGVILLNLQNNLWGGNWIGALALLLSPMTWALGSALASRIKQAPGLMASATQMLAGGAMMLILSPLVGEKWFEQVPSIQSVGAWIYLILIGSIVAYTAYNFLLKRTRPTLATSYAYVNPVVAVGLGILFANEQVSWQGVTAMFIILAGVGLLSLGKLKRG